MDMSSLNTTATSLYSICAIERRLLVPPWSRPLLLSSLAAYGLLKATQILLLSHSVIVALIGGGASMLLLVATTWAVLALNGCGQRLRQSLIALAASGSVVAIANILLSLLIWIALPIPMQTGIPGFLLFPLFLWNLGIYSNVFKHALSGQPAFAFGVSLAYLLLVFVALQELFKLEPYLRFGVPFLDT